ncbi:type II secretion system protein F (GspF) [Rahnella sp. BIGb0236]|uniref:type II secretion system inner membrane protein GspF n=1 Tax=Rahnella sp. BIGb0236 TaxID=2485117 RepID=UPI001060A893|nr:type II secretion system inner membrane protein GspF [Rahnella sp. BIGb0236]TDS93304.1 type II secretion system protein F (GspF) [Rahnella sp. BIGb0236]VTQ56834.1 type II secretion system protein [Campylobacter jejuni]
MSRFSFHATSVAGKTQRGVIEADNLRQARQMVRERGLTLLDIKQVGNSLTASKMKSKGLKTRVPSHAVSLFSRQLATLTNAALPVEAALAVIARQTEHAGLTQVLTAIRHKVVEGHTLADALADFPRIFDPMFRTLVTAGERTGQLGSVLEKMADYYEIRQQIKSKLSQAMIYPAMLTIVAILVIIILLVAVVPQIIEQFVHMKHTLPITTRILIGISGFLERTWWLLAIGIFATIAAAKLVLRRKNNLMRFHTALLSVAVFGPLIRAINSARYARTLSILQSSGVPLLDAMKISTEGITNLRIHSLLVQAAENVRQGSSLFAVLEQTRLFPPMMLYMIASGEQSGRLGELMAHAADNQDKLMQHRLSMALALFEPLLIVTMASIVLFIIMSILQPILQLNNLVS